MAKAKTEDVAGATEQAGDTAAVPAAAEAPRTVQARVLTQCDLGGPNDVIDVDTEVATARADVLDTDPAAVAYALSQRF